jgi:hypothetical protein
MNPPYETVSWADVSSAAARMFKVWGSGGELAWAEECWGHFQKAGLAGDETVIQRTATLLRLVTLARIYQEFCGYAWEENSDAPIDFLAENLDINPVALGILAARVAPDAFDEDYSEDEYDLREFALTLATNAQRKEIHAALCAAYGDEIMLYSRMSRTYPSKDDEGHKEVGLGSVGEFLVTAGNCQALHYVQSGFCN